MQFLSAHTDGALCDQCTTTQSTCFMDAFGVGMQRRAKNIQVAFKLDLCLGSKTC